MGGTARADSLLPAVTARYHKDAPERLKEVPGGWRVARAGAACDNAHGAGEARSIAGEGYTVPGRGLLRALIVLAAVGGVAAYALRKLGIIGADEGGSAIEYSGSSADDGEDESADK